MPMSKKKPVLYLSFRFSKDFEEARQKPEHGRRGTMAERTCGLCTVLHQQRHRQTHPRHRKHLYIRTGGRQSAKGHEKAEGPSVRWQTKSMDNFQGLTPSYWPFFSAFNAFRIFFFIIFPFQLGLFCGAFVVLLISVVLSWIFYDFSVVGSNEEPKVGIVANKDINKELKNDWRIVARYAHCKLFSEPTQHPSRARSHTAS